VTVTIGFPHDFMFQLSAAEDRALRSQTVTLDADGRGTHRKCLPYAFTEQGVAMLSSVSRSPRAVQVTIEIMRAFVRLGESETPCPRSVFPELRTFSRASLACVRAFAQARPEPEIVQQPVGQFPWGHKRERSRGALRARGCTTGEEGTKGSSRHQVGIRSALSGHQVQAVEITPVSRSLQELMGPSCRTDRTKFRDQVGPKSGPSRNPHENGGARAPQGQSMMALP
jgi:hypothetical protein